MSLRTRISSLALACLVSLTTAFAQPPVPPVQRFAYHDDHDQRRLADIAIKAIRNGDAPALEITIAAVGPAVEPMPGFAGLRGRNRNTAEQIENILLGTFPFAAATDGDTTTFGTWHGGRRGKILERTLRPDGRIDFWAPTPRDYPLELIVNTGPLGNGRRTTILWFNGMPRFRIVSEATGAEVKVLAVASLGDPSAGALDVDPPPAPPEVDAKPVEIPLPKITLDDADWNARDNEGKWSLFKKTIGDDDRKAKAFVDKVAARKDFAFLEMIALHQPLYDGSIHAARVLANADAPQWLRVAVHLRRLEKSHGEAETARILFRINPAKAMAWHEKYLPTLQKTDKLQRTMAVDLESYRKLKVKPADLGDALPPLADADLFSFLDAPKNLIEFGDRKRAEPDTIYLDQVLRAIKTYAFAGERREPLLGKMLTLTRHPNVRVRQSAYLAYPEFARQLDPKNLPIDEFRRVLDDPMEPAAIREAALFAFSAFAHPQVFVRLHEIALNTSHPAWKAAVSQLDYVGSEFTVEHLIRVKSANLSDENSEHLLKVHAAIRDYFEQASVRSRELTDYEIVRTLEKAAYSETTKSPVANDLTPWTKSYLANRFRADPSPKFAAALQKIAQSYEPRDSIAEPEEMTRLVRAWAREIATKTKE